MKIGIITTWFERGAAYVSKQYEELLSQGHEVFIYARGGESYAKGDDLWDRPNVTWGRKALFQTNDSPVSKRDFIKWIKKNDLELLFFNEQQWWPPVLWARDQGVVVGAYVDYYTEETVPLFGVYDFLICNTKRHLEAFDWHPEAHFVQWGTDVTLFKPGVKPAEDQEKVVFFCSVGMNPDRKGAKPLLDAFSKLTHPRAKLLLHTQVDLRKYYPQDAEFLDSLEDSGRLEIVTKSVTAPGLYYRGDVYVYISKLDGIGLTLAEAAASGLPIITPNQPPMSEFVVDGETGKLVDVRRRYARADGYYWPQCEVNIDSLVEALGSYADKFNELELLKSDARAVSEQRFDWNKNKNHLCRIFSEAKSSDVSTKELEAIKRYEFRRMPYWPLLRLPYKIYKALRR